MKTTILKSVMTVLMALFSFNAFAYDVKIDGIYYNLIERKKQAEVTGGGSGEVTIPASIEHDGVTYSVTSIGSSAFSGCIDLTSVNIPNNVTSIGSSAFYGCKNMEDLYCYAENIPTTYGGAFQDAYVEYATLHVPAASLEDYKSAAPWSGFGTIVALEGDAPETPKCETPTIAYENGKLAFSCATEGAEFVSEITDEDIKKHYDSKVKLNVTYNISVYATAAGYENSDAVTATLCWIETEPKGEELLDGVIEVKAYPVLIQSKDGQITVQGVADKAKVEVYTLGGTEAGNGIAANGIATISTNLNSGEIAVVKIGEKSVKIVVK
jgi:hypothetical protein